MTGAARALTARAPRSPARLNTGGAPTKAHIEFGATTAYGATTADQRRPGLARRRRSPRRPAGLPAGTTIHYRAVADTDFGTVVRAPTGR